MSTKINIPLYRVKEIKIIYEIFCDENPNNKDLSIRKKMLYKIFKARFRWINREEFEQMYTYVEKKEKKIILDEKKANIYIKYKEKIIKLFCFLDRDNNNVLSLDEFKMLMIKFDIANQVFIENVFKNIDLNGDGKLSIDEFLIFLIDKNELLERMDDIIESKLEYEKKIDIRNILFKDFPGASLISSKNWRPSLANLNSLELIGKRL